MQEEKYGNFKMQDEMAVQTERTLSGTTLPNPLFGQVFPYAYTSADRYLSLHHSTIPAVHLLPIEEYLSEISARRRLVAENADIIIDNAGIPKI